MKILCSKWILLPAYLLILRTSVTAQTNFGIKGSLNLADLTYRSKAQDIQAKPLGSFSLGCLLDYPFSRWSSFEPGIMVSGKGARIKQQTVDGTLSYKLHPWYVEIPVDLLFKPAISYTTRLYFGGGPYLAFGVGGRASYDSPPSPLNPYSDHRIRFGNGQNADMRRTDLGLHLSAGAEFSRSMLLGLQYGFSLRNLAPSKSQQAPDVLKNKVFGISLTLLFGRSYYSDYYY